MSVFGLRDLLNSHFQLTGESSYEAWAAAQTDDTKLTVEAWLIGLYDAPWQAPSVPVAQAHTWPHEYIRKAEIKVRDRIPVLIYYAPSELVAEVAFLYAE